MVKKFHILNPFGLIGQYFIKIYSIISRTQKLVFPRKKIRFFHSTKELLEVGSIFLKGRFQEGVRELNKRNYFNWGLHEGSWTNFF